MQPCPVALSRGGTVGCERTKVCGVYLDRQAIRAECSKNSNALVGRSF
jgi:hypothetical protein